MSKQFDINRQDFRQWLSNFDKNDIVGKAGSGSSCPMYEFLKASGEPVTHVAPTYTLMKGSRYYRNPAWVTKFVSQIDFYHAPHEAVYAQRALSILGTI